MMFFLFSQSGYGYGYGYSYGRRYSRYRQRYGYYNYGYGKRGMKKIASRQRTNNVHADLNDDAKIEHLNWENVAEN